MSGPARFLAWWRSELVGLVPSGLRHMLSSTAPQLIILPGPDGLALSLQDGRATEELGALDAISPDRMARLTRAVARLRLRVVLAVPRSEIITRRVTLPIKAEAELDAVLGFEIDRLTPFSVEDLFFARQIRARHPQRGLIEVDLSFLPRASVGAALAALQAADLPPDHIAPTDAAGVVEATELTPSGRPPRARMPVGLRLMQTGLGALGLVFCFWGLAAHLDLLRRASLLETDLIAVRQAALAAAAPAEARAPGSAADVAFSRHETRPLVVSTLAALTDALPDETSATRLTLTPDRVEVSGDANDATALIVVIDAVDGFAEPRFIAPVTRDETSAQERFSLSFTVEAKPAP